jgi:hypothetical protein
MADSDQPTQQLKQIELLPELLKKPNEFLVMIPKVGRMPMLARKIYNAMLHATQLQMQEMRKQLVHFDAGSFFHGRVTDLVASVLANKSNPIGQVIKHLGEMRATEVDWRAPDAKSEVVWESIGMLSEVRVLMKSDGYWVSWSFPPTLFDAICDMRVYTQIDQSVIAQLTSYAAVTLYEICARYKHNPSGHTAKQSPDWWVDALTGTAPKIDKETGLPQKRREWRKFKDASLPEALDEINNFSDIEVKLIETKTGRAVTAVQFQVKLKKVEKPKPVRNISKAMLEQAVKSDVPLSTISSFLSKGKSEEVVMYGLQKLEKRGNATHLSSVENKTAYLKHLLNDAEGRVKGDGAEANKQASQTPQPEKQIMSWEDNLRAEVRREFLFMTKDDQKPYVLGAAAKMEAAGILTLTFKRKIDEGSWTAGHILAASVEFYATEKYGANWLKELHAV